MHRAEQHSHSAPSRKLATCSFETMTDRLQARTIVQTLPALLLCIEQFQKCPTASHFQMLEMVTTTRFEVLVELRDALRDLNLTFCLNCFMFIAKKERSNLIVSDAQTGPANKFLLEEDLAKAFQVL